MATCLSDCRQLMLSVLCFTSTAVFKLIFHFHEGTSIYLMAAELNDVEQLRKPPRRLPGHVALLLISLSIGVITGVSTSRTLASYVRTNVGAHHLGTFEHGFVTERICTQRRLSISPNGSSLTQHLSTRRHVRGRPVSLHWRRHLATKRDREVVLGSFQALLCW